MPQFANHLYVVAHTLLQALGLEGLAYLREELHLLLQVLLYLTDGGLLRVLAGHEQVGRVDAVVLERTPCLHALRVQFLYGLYLVVPVSHPQHRVGISQPDVHRVANGTHVAAVGRDIVAHVKRRYEFAQKVVAVQSLAHPYVYAVLAQCERVAHTVDARHGPHHYHILSAR